MGTAAPCTAARERGSFVIRTILAPLACIALLAACPRAATAGAAGLVGQESLAHSDGDDALGPLPLALQPPPVAAVALRLAPLPLGVITFPNGKAVNLTVGMGGGAFHGRGDPPGRFWLVTSRGPTIACDRARALIGLDPGELCAGDPAGRILPLPGFAPTIYGLETGGDVARVIVTLPLKGRSGRPVTGLSNPLEGARIGPSFDAGGRVLATDPGALDPGALVRTSDGGFWIADQQASSLVRVAPDGTVQRRIVPNGDGGEFAGADYDVREGLPAKLSRGPGDRGFQSLALSSDERFLYLVSQRGPEAAGTLTDVASPVRVIKLLEGTGEVVADYLYALDPPAAFRRDAARAPHTQGDVRVTETVALGPDALLVLERIDHTTRMFRVDFTGATPLPPDFDGKSAAPESFAPGLSRRPGFRPLVKTLLLDSDDVPGVPRRIGGVAVMAENSMIVVNDNQSGVDGAETKLVRLLFANPILR